MLHGRRQSSEREERADYSLYYAGTVPSRPLLSLEFQHNTNISPHLLPTPQLQPSQIKIILLLLSSLAGWLAVK